MELIGIDFEMANATAGSLCAYGLAREESQHYGVLKLHPEVGGVQERHRFHGITQQVTDLGMPPSSLYELLESLPADTVLAAHDARIDRAQLAAWFSMWDFPPLHFRWIDTLKIARKHFGKDQKTGIAAMAERMGISVRPHDPYDDAFVAREIALRFDWGTIQLLEDK